MGSGGSEADILVQPNRFPAQLVDPPSSLEVMPTMQQQQQHSSPGRGSPETLQPISCSRDRDNSVIGADC